MKHQSSTLAVPETSAVPRHVAIIMDGNGRWATKRFLPRVAGHAKGVDAVRSIVEASAERGIEFLTLFAFSSENWRRPADEVSVLMRLFMTVLEREVGKMANNGIRLRIVGDMSRFDPKLQEMAAKAEEQTAGNSRLTLTVCANYGGRWDVMQAVSRMVKDKPGATDYSEEELAPYLAMAYAPEPDLFIRTGGEQRISNFLLWQLAYSELYFTETFWPDFDAKALDQAIGSYQQRERRFGRTSAQVLDQKKGFLMLKTRVITALILLAILLPILYFGYFPAFAMAVLVFFAAGAWECFRLFKSPRPTVWALVWTLVFSVILFFSGLPSVRALYVLCVLLWALRFVPALGLGLPRIEAFGNRLLNGTYMLSILGCFVAIVDLFQHSPLYLLSVMAVVWVADIGAYFSGKGFGRHKLAPTISPGKSWEGAIGGWLAVLVISAAVAMSMSGGETFQYHLFNRWGWGGFVGILSLMVVASVVGDLFESQLKRRAGMKDSSNLLPGHGGVLDRIDALIPVLPLAALVDLWLAAS